MTSITPDPGAASTPAAAELQFETAEFASAGALRNCGACATPIADTYYEVAQQVVCGVCRDRIDELRKGEGSNVRAYLRAMLYGGLAAMASAIVWYAIVRLTGYQLGLIAVGIGLAVGYAVKTGARGRGGWKYQALAMFLAYGAIVTSYVPEILKVFSEGAQKAALAKTSDGSARPAAGPSAEKKAATTAEPGAANDPSAAKMTLALLAFFVFVWAFAFAAPFLGGWQNIIGIIIIGFALWEAWKINKRVVIDIRGPFQLAPIGPGTSPSPSSPAADDPASTEAPA